MFSLLARDRTATAVRFSWFPITRASTPRSANDRRISSSSGVHGLVANRPISVISPSPSARASISAGWLCFDHTLFATAAAARPLSVAGYSTSLDVRLKWRQPTQVDQSVVPGATDIAGGVFAAAAGNNLADQLEIFILHEAPNFHESH